VVMTDGSGANGMAKRTAPGTKKRLRAQPVYAVPALEKGLDIVELVASKSAALTGSQIAAELKRSSGEIFRILHCLERRGIIERRQPGDRYGLTVRLLEMALAYPPIDRLLTSAIPIMQDIAATIRQSCHLSVREGAHTLIVAQVPSPAPIGFAVRRGARFTLTTGISGPVLLAYRKPVEFALWKKAIEEDPDVPPITEALMASFENIRAQNYGMAPSPICPGVTDIGVPIFDDSGDATAALTVPHFAMAETKVAAKEIPALLIKAASLISDSLGGGKLEPRLATPPSAATTARLRKA
jgi:DNA-binding IclR family transcriptional regulator